jgi:hypothetical protein
MAFSLAGEFGADGLLPPVTEAEESPPGGLLPVVSAVVDTVDPVSFRSGNGKSMLLLWILPIAVEGTPVPVGGGTKDMPLIPTSRLRVSTKALVLAAALPLVLSLEPCMPLL